MNFQLFGKKSIELDSQYTLHYSHEGSYAVVCISQKPDVTLYEAFNFIDRLKEGMAENPDLTDIQLIQS